MNPRKRTNEEAFTENCLISPNAQSRKRQIFPLIQRLEMVTGLTRSNNHRAVDPDSLFREASEFTPPAPDREDLGFKYKVVNLIQQLASSQAKRKEAEKDLESLKSDYKFEVDAADRLTLDNIDLKSRVRGSDIEIGELQGGTQEAEIRVEQLEATNLELKRVYQEAQLRTKVAEARTVILEKRLQNEQDRADQFEAANLDDKRMMRDVQERVKKTQAIGIGMKVDIEEMQRGAEKAEDNMMGLEDQAMLAYNRIADLERQLRLAGDQTRGFQRQLKQFQEHPNQMESVAVSTPPWTVQAQDAALPKQCIPQNCEQLHIAYVKSLVDGFATAKAIIEFLETSLLDKEVQIHDMKVREESFRTENAGLENKNIELTTEVDDLRRTLWIRGAIMKDAVAELDHNRVRWYEEIQRNDTAEKQLQEENETLRMRDKSGAIRRRIEEQTVSNNQVSKLEEEKLDRYIKCVSLEEDLKRSVEDQDGLREQIGMLEEQIQEMMGDLIFSDGENERSFDAESSSSVTETGACFDHPEDEDKGNDVETPGDYERQCLDATCISDNGDSRSGDSDDSEDLTDIKDFLAQVATLYQRHFVESNIFKTRKITVQNYKHQQAEVKLELDAIRLTPSREHALKEWSSLREDILVVGGDEAHMNFLKETIILMAFSKKRYRIANGKRVLVKEQLASLLQRLPKPRKRTYEEDAEEEGWGKGLVPCPIKCSRTS